MLPDFLRELQSRETRVTNPAGRPVTTDPPISRPLAGKKMIPPPLPSAPYRFPDAFFPLSHPPCLPQQSLLEEMRVHTKRLADMRKHEDPRLSFSTPEFREAQARAFV